MSSSSAETGVPFAASVAGALEPASSLASTSDTPRPHWRRILTLLVVGVTLGGATSLYGRSFESERPWQDISPTRQGLAGALLPSRAARIAPGLGGGKDVHLAWIRTTPSGQLLDLWGPSNITRTPTSDEALLITTERALAYAKPSPSSPETFDTIEVIELNNRTQWHHETFAGQLAEMLTNLEQWGQLRAPRHLRIDLESSTPELELEWRNNGELVIRSERGESYLDIEKARFSHGVELATVTELSKGAPDLFRWAVDHLRYSQFIGPHRLQRLEAAYLSLDDAYRGYTEQRRRPEDLTELSQQLGPPAVPQSSGNVSWPPPPLDSILDPELEGEGVWRERDGRFLTKTADTPPLFFTTFIRTDPERPSSSRIFLTVWDPRWLELDWVAGTVEPRSIAGLQGTGKVPSEKLERLVAGFNGGFQAVDGAFGMKTTAGPFLPPVAYSATIARLENDRLGLGTWPERSIDDEELVAYRQNLTALVEGGEVNPYGRRFWGGVPASLRDTSRTDRTGLCLTEDHHLVYLWGQRVTVAGLAEAMDLARCSYGMLLDINFSNTVFELYNIAPEGQLPPLDRPLDLDWEREGRVSGREDLLYRVQTMAPGMTRVGFPRYIRTELRDFFYLALRPETLGPPLPSLCSLEALDDGTGGPPRAWMCELPQRSGSPVALYLLDPRRLELSRHDDSSEEEHWFSFAADFDIPIDRLSSSRRISEEGEVMKPKTIILRQHQRGGMEIVVLEEDSSHQGEPGEVILRGVDIDGSDLADGSAWPGLLAAVTPHGKLILGATQWPACRSLWPRLRANGIRHAIFVPTGGERLAVGLDESPMAIRIFEDEETTPAPQRVWGPIHRRAQQHITEQGLTRHYVQIRHYLERDR